jgi:hypothetical protein
MMPCDTMRSWAEQTLTERKEEVRQTAKAIDKLIAAGELPPWPEPDDYGVTYNEDYDGDDPRLNW